MGIISSTSRVYRVWRSKWRISTPFFAMEMMPVSSLTTTAMASEFSAMPRQARWRVPISLPRSRLLDRGNTQPAALMRPFSMIAAPSCRGVPS